MSLDSSGLYLQTLEYLKTGIMFNINSKREEKMHFNWTITQMT